ncbi:alpha/beta hydrolase [Inediibacterium massiliense]|uniref:alpha/beta hydrolase n=1 Tax=Inediibacterium massiliense TaxID=1658111 RepID=UPI0006B69DC3|nr:alpha/beta hydrolase [Inediibacterium massiliense]
MYRKDYIYKRKGEIPIESTLYKTTLKQSIGTIIYFHGGGLIWGNRNDLPEKYIQIFLEHGYNFISFDYRLAPETKLTEIYEDVQDALKWFDRNAFNILQLDNKQFYLFGRSAGSYLSFLLAKDPFIPKPSGLIIFYGYSNLKDDFYNQPNKHYLHYPNVTQKLRDALIQNKPLTNGQLNNRFAIYVYARQNGTWARDMLENPIDPYFSLTKNDLALLPKTFLAHSKTDLDVPFSIAQYHAKNIPKVKLYEVDDLEHDFDQNINNPIGEEVYKEIIRFFTNK